MAYRLGYDTIYQWDPVRGYASLAILIPPDYKLIRRTKTKIRALWGHPDSRMGSNPPKALPK